MSWSDLPQKLKILIVALASISIPIVFHASSDLVYNPHASYWIVLTVLAVLTVPFFLFLPSVNSIIGIGDAYIMAIAMLEGTSPCVIATLFHTITASIFAPNRPKVYAYRVVFNSSSMVCGAWLYSTLFSALNPTHSTELDVLVLPAAMLTIVFFLFNSLITSTAISWASGQRMTGFWVKNCLPLAIDFSVSAVSACIIVSLKTVSSYLPLAVAPLVGLVWGWNKVIKSRVIEAERHLKEQEQLYLRTVESLAMAVDAKDQTTYGHIRRVKAYAMGLAKLCDIKNANDLMAIETGSLLHDIGKLAIDDYILNKPGKLTKQEFEKMKLHSAAGDEILQQIQFPFPVAKVVRYHHERWDGYGYPDGLKGEAIPLGARILAIVDAYDAIRSSRPYKSSFGREDAVELLRSQSGTLYDPNLINLFITHLDGLEAAAEKAAEDIPKLSFRKYFETLDRAISASLLPEAGGSLPAPATAELVMLFEFTNGPGRQLELQEILHILARRLQRLIPYSTCAFYLSNDDDSLRAVCAIGQYSEILQDLRIELGKGISGWVAAYKRPMINTRPALEFQGIQADLSTFTDALVVPLITDSECIGTISLYAQPPVAYSHTHLSVLQAFASLASPLIQEIRKSDRPEQNLIDPITNTYRVGYLSVVGPQMIAQAERSESPLSLLLIEIRGLNQVTRLYGNSAGESLLHRVAEKLRAELRETDVLVRFGHQGFLALLPGVRGDKANRFSSRLQQQVSNSAPASIRGHATLLDFKTGTASYPIDGTTVFSLLQVAQQALAAKSRSAGAADADIERNILEFPPRI